MHTRFMPDACLIHARCIPFSGPVKCSQGPSCPEECFFTDIGIISGNLSLKYIYPSFNQMIGASSPLITVLMASAMGTRYNLWTWLSMPVICGGLCICGALGFSRLSQRRVDLSVLKSYLDVPRLLHLHVEKRVKKERVV